MDQDRADETSLVATLRYCHCQFYTEQNVNYALCQSNSSQLLHNCMCTRNPRVRRAWSTCNRRAAGAPGTRRPRNGRRHWTVKWHELRPTWCRAVGAVWRATAPGHSLDRHERHTPQRPSLLATTDTALPPRNTYGPTAPLWWSAESVRRYVNKSRSSYYVRWQRGTARIRPPLLLQSVDVSCLPGPQQQTCSSGFAAVGPCWDRQTDGQRTPYDYIDPAPHTVLAVPVIGVSRLAVVTSRLTKRRS